MQYRGMSSATTQIATGLSRIGTVIRAERQRAASEQALSPTQAQILGLLTARGPARLSVLAAELAVSQPTASDAVAALVRKGHVERRADPDDGRATRLYATDSGSALAKSLAGWPEALLGAIDVLDETERAVLVRALMRVIVKLQDEGAIPVQKMCATCLHFRPNAHPGAERPHHCAFVDAPFGDAALRIDCADHAEAGPRRVV